MLPTRSLPCLAAASAVVPARIRGGAVSSETAADFLRGPAAAASGTGIAATPSASAEATP
ncbi:hypothetical protein [Jannaschia seohaensis]|uniref:Uncharacterized protein n=1 Tax=Jannaschia seohaensis TaxID=475081 RepID=A0A2Y9A269_9RHOB|nr:hypothetical protein [Jannaschia seohaensis]PWJ22077.1 hypothetical protein BCF38_101486 [Jannaschia seohaensis]SSA38355.1 hypothetical protein SAMN05421539_101486 [Jannaschia seohaensis]